MTENLDQIINIIPKDSTPRRIEFANNKFLDNLFQQRYIGLQETDMYTVLVGEDEFLKLYHYFTRVIGHGVDEKEDEALLEVYEEMYDVIREGQLQEVQLEYVLYTNEEEEEEQ